MRIHKNYVSGTIPAGLIAKPAQWVLNNVMSGCVAVTNADDPRRDPDTAATAVGTLYTHPQFPGLMFTKVSSMAELFQKGSSFIADRGYGDYMGLIGAHAEAFLLGDNVNIPHVMYDSTQNQHLLTYTNSPESRGRLAYSSRSSSIATGLLYDGEPSVTAEVAGARLDALLPETYRTGGWGSGLSVGCRNILLDRNQAMNPTPWTIMSIVTPADAGWVAKTNVDYTEQTLGQKPSFACMYDEVVIGTLGGIVESYYPTFYDGVPSGAKKFARRAWDDELTPSVADYQVKRLVGVRAFKTGNASAPVACEVGWMLPRPWTVSGALTLQPTTTNRLRPAGEVKVVGMKGGVLEQEAKHALRLMAGMMRVSGSDLVASDLSFVSEPAVRYSAGDLLVHETAALSGTVDGDKEITDANARGTDNMVSGVNTRVPTLKGSGALVPIMEILCSDEHGMMTARKLKDFFRRVSIRMEQYARAM